jgi:4-hydroxyphenylacetate 3-monooxygenase/4-hydroxybutyryl-CoA dehydratase/vinylacetyl-CoA-Delta-isomerase
MGSTALAAEYNGVEGAQHINHKLADLISVAELVYGAGIAAAVKSKASSSGTFIPDVVYCNVGRRHAGESLYHEYQILSDVAGGIPATLPHEEDFYDEEIGPLLNKYIMRKSTISAEDQHRCFRMIHDIVGCPSARHRQLAGSTAAARHHGRYRPPGLV